MGVPPPAPPSPLMPASMMIKTESGFPHGTPNLDPLPMPMMHFSPQVSPFMNGAGMHAHSMGDMFPPALSLGGSAAAAHHHEQLHLAPHFEEADYSLEASEEVDLHARQVNNLYAYAQTPVVRKHIRYFKARNDLTEAQKVEAIADLLREGARSEVPDSPEEPESNDHPMNSVE